jgi:ADP-ribosyl-[dinitrogen reductase] hydrolase
MRIGPVGLVYYKDLPKAKALAERCSSLTHPYPTNAEACQLYTVLIVKSLHGASKDELADVAAYETQKFKDADLRSRLDGYRSLSDWQARHSDEIKSSGYVVSTLEAALWSFFTTSTFQEGAIRAVNLGLRCGGDVL